MNFDIQTKNNSDTELFVKGRLERLLTEYDISAYAFTDKVLIEERAIPHSHPVLTINSFPYADQKMHLTDLIHEQLHWYFEEKQEAVDKAVAEFKTKYQDVPTGHPHGCRDETSTYEHLLLCRLCHKIAIQLLGEQSADLILHYLQNHHYLWVYETIDEDAEYIDSLLAKYGLDLR